MVTGGAGFVGFYLSKHLANQGIDVTIIDNLSRGKQDEEFLKLISTPNVHFIPMDLTDTEQLRKLEGTYDEIYHLAAINGTKHFYERPQEVLKVNILALMNMLEWANSSNCGKFLFTSSSEAYAGTISSFPDPDRFIPTNEEIPLTIVDVFNPRYSYGGSKLVGELLTVNYCRTKNIPFSIIRYHNIYAGRMGFEHVIPQFCERIYNKENPFIIYGGTETRAFCYVDDATRATQSVMENQNCNGEIINIGNSKEEVTIIDLAKKLLEINSLEVEIRVEDAPPGSVQRRCPSTKKLNNLTGYEPRVSLDEGLQSINSWYMEEFSRRESNE